MAAQKRLEVVDLAFVDRALGEHDHVDALLASGDQDPVQEVQIEAFGGRKLEKPERVLAQPPHRALDWAEVRCTHAQRPRQQQQRGVLGPKIRTAMASRDLVPPSLDARKLHAGLARKGRPSRGGEC